MSPWQENTHRLTLSMSPDENYLGKQAKEEEEKLQRKIKALSDADRTDIYEKGNRDATTGLQLQTGTVLQLLPMWRNFTVSPVFTACPRLNRMKSVQHGVTFVRLLILQRSRAAGSSESDPGRLVSAGAPSVRRAAHDTCYSGPDGFSRYSAASTSFNVCLRAAP